MTTGIENADTGHIADEVNIRLAEADQAAHRAYTAAQSLAELVSAIQYTSDPIGADSRRVVESRVGTLISKINERVRALDEFQDQIRAAQAVQQGADDESAEKLDVLGQSIR